MGLLTLALGSMAIFASTFLGSTANAEPPVNPLPSWNPGIARQAIVDFVAATTREGLPTFVPPGERIAVFDNDGTLWTEYPFPAQAMFAIDRVRAMAADHPEWRTQQPFAAILAGDRAALGRMTEHDAAALIAATHSGMTTENFERIVAQWLATAVHPRFNRPYTECTYQPMLELLQYLRDNGFQTFIVSGGGTDFMRTFAQRVYGVRPAQVVGSSGKMRFEVRGGRAVLVKLPEITSVDDKDGKPINIEQRIGQRPIFAFGNSDGDLQMLQYTTLGSRPGFAGLVHHDDADREYAYDVNGQPWGRLDKALDAANLNGWTVVSMKRDWRTIFPH